MNAVGGVIDDMTIAAQFLTDLMNTRFASEFPQGYKTMLLDLGKLLITNWEHSYKVQKVLFLQI